MDRRFSGCEIIELGVQIEKNGKAFYSALAKLADNSSAAAIFEYLANAEEKHIRVFREIFTSSCDYEPDGAFPDDYFAYMRSMASQYVFTQENKGEEIAKTAKSYDEGIDLGIQFEKESILFYEGMKKMLSEKDGKLVDEVIIEEKKHMRQLCDLKGGTV